MEPIETVYVTGYRSFEIGVFKENDPKIKVIKNVLNKEIRALVEEGVTWVIISGNLGVELWTAEVVAKLKEEYPELNLGILYPFADFGSQWNETNKMKQTMSEQLADYVASVSSTPYQSPMQLRNHTQFLLQHTNASLLIYDEEYPGKTAYFYKDAKKYQEKNNYEIRAITMDDLQNSME